MEIDCFLGIYICVLVCDFGDVFGVGGYVMVLWCICVGCFELD